MNGNGGGEASLHERKAAIGERLNALGVEQRGVDDRIRQLERQINSEQRKVRATFEGISAQLEELERQRTRLSLSLTDEKSLLKQMDKLRAERKALEHIEQLKKELEQVKARKEELTRKVIGSRLLRKQVEANMQEMELMERISQSKGGVPITSDMMVERIEMIPRDRIGQFVGKMGSNLNKLEQTHFVSLDVSNDGYVTITGVEEDVAAAASAIEEFRAEVVEEMTLSAAQIKILKSNKGSHLKNIESLLNVSLVLVSDGKGDGGTLKMRGLPMALQRAKDAISEIAAKTTYIDIIPNGTFMRTLLAQSGAELHAIEKVYSVGLHIDREKGQISITGSQKQVSLVEAKLQQMAQDLEDETAEMELEDQEYVSCIIGKKGATIRQIQSNTGVNITIRKPSAEDTATTKPTVILKGPRAKLQLAMGAIQQTIETYRRENLTLQFPEASHSALYGQGGSTIRRLQEESGANITLQKREERSDGIINVYIRGAEENVRKAAQEIQAIIDSQAYLEMPISEDAKPAIIGQKGNVISRMQKETGANISVHDSKAIIRGTKEQVEAARGLIEARLDRFQRENRVVLVLSSAIGTLIGKGGSTLRKIRETTGAQVDVSMANEHLTHPDSSKKDKYGTIVPASVVRVRGPEAAVVAAVDEISRMMEENIVSEEDREAFRCMSVSIPSVEATRKLVGKSGETIRGIESEFNVRIMVERDQGVVQIRGRAGHGILQATETVRNLLEQGVHLKEKLVNVGKPVQALCSDATALKRIQDESGATISVLENDENTKETFGLVIEGPAASVRLAKELLAEVDEGVEREILKVAPAHVSTLATTAKPNVDRLESEHAVSITLDESKSSIRLSGQPKKLIAAKSALLQLLRFFFPTQVANFPLPSPALISIVIGKKGSTIRKIQQDYNVNINIDRESNSVDIIASSDDSAKRAVQAIQEIVDAWNREHHSMHIPREAIPSIIGKKGATIQSVKAESGVQSIDIDRSVPCIRLKGDPDSIPKAVSLLKQLVEKFERENSAVTIDYEEVAWLIGPKGSTIRSIQDTTGASLKIEKGSNVVFLQGTEETIQAAKSEIQRVLTKQRELAAQRQAEEQERRRKDLEARRLRQRQEQLEEESRKQRTDSLTQPPGLEKDQDDGSIVKDEASFSYLDSLTFGTPVEFDTTRLRHHHLVTPSEISTPVAENRVSGSDVMSMLLGAPDPSSSSASLSTSQEHNNFINTGSHLESSHMHTSLLSNSVSTSASGFNQAPQLTMFGSAVAPSPFAPTGNALPDLTGPDFASFLASDAFAAPTSIPGISPLQSNAPPGFSSTLPQPPFQTQASDSNSDSKDVNDNQYYTGDGGYSIRLS